MIHRRLIYAEFIAFRLGTSKTRVESVLKGEKEKRWKRLEIKENS